MIMLFAAAGIIIFFVYNIIAVNSLVVDIANVQTEVSKSITINNNLQTEIERLSNFDNIKNTAVDKLGLEYSITQPKKITVQKSELDNLTE